MHTAAGLPQLKPFPEFDWDRALAVVAHPDDLEYGTAGAIAQWTRQGRQVSYLLVTRGEAGIDGMAPEEAGPVRVQEQLASAAVVGVRDVEFLDYPDGLVEYSIGLRREIAAAVRRVQPQLVLTVNHRETWPQGGLNMADHRVVGMAAVDAVRDAANRWLFPELGLAPWSGVQWVAISGSPKATHAVDIHSTLDIAVESLRAHVTYLQSLGGQMMADADGFLRGTAEQVGQRFHGAPAIAFELIAA